MDAARRIVVLDDDARVRQLVQSAFKPPAFEVHAFSDGRDALMKLHDIRPDLILSDVWMPDLDGRVFLQVVKRSPALQHVPFVFLTAVRTDAAIEAALQAGADAFLMKPLPLALLVERVRALLGVAREPEDAPPAAAAGHAATLAHDTSIPEPWRHGEAVDTERDAAAPTSAGRYLPAELEGRFTVVSVAGQRVPVLTEAWNRPNFTVVTCMTSGGRAVRKVETSWHHPLERREDLVLAQRQIKLQHEQALAALAQLGLGRTPRHVVWDAGSRLVNGALLCWAVGAVVESAVSRYGPEPALGVFRGGFERLGRSLEALRVLRFNERGRVVLQPHTGPLVPQTTLGAVAQWLASCVGGTSKAGGEAAAAAIARATAARGAQLERSGFYAAVAAAVRRAERAASVA